MSEQKKKQQKPFAKGDLQLKHVGKVNISSVAIAPGKLKITLAIVIGLFAFALYFQSISFDYTLDDTASVAQNKIVNRGFSGIPDLLKSDYWFGYSGNIRVPQYRPASLIMFAIEWNFFPGNPHVSHFMNVLLYAITCSLLFILLYNLFKNQKLIFAFVCALLYAAHPIHTEVVDNIKSRDEILCFLFGIVSSLFVLKYYSKNSILYLVLAGLFLFFSLTSKETGITFLVVIPLLLFFFKDTNYKKIGDITLVLAGAAAIYLFIRYKILESIPVVYQVPLLDNTMVGAENYFSRVATAFYILLKYLLLLIVPHPLSSDYSFSQIAIQTFSSPAAIFALFIYSALGFYAILTLRKKNILSFAILFYLITLSPVSNLFLLIGSTMAERFMYMPSLGFCIAISFLLLKYSKTKNINQEYNGIKQFYSLNSSVLLIAFLLTGVYSIRTFARSQDWKSNLSLYSHDVKIVENSARMHYNLGVALLHDAYYLEKNSEAKKEILLQSIHELETALTILPSYQDAHKSLGFLYLKNGEFEKSITQLDLYTKSNQTEADVFNNKGCALLGLENYSQAIPVFQKAIDLSPQDTAVYKNIGRCYVYLHQYAKAIENFSKCLELDSTDSENYKFIGLSYQLTGDSVKAKSFLEKAALIK